VHEDDAVKTTVGYHSLDGIGSQAVRGSPEIVEPVEVTGDVDAANDQQIWQAVPDTEDANLVVGFSQP